MDNDGQRLLDVINDPNALESFLGGNGAPPPQVDQSTTLAPMSTATAITQEQLASLQQQIQQQQAQLIQLQQLQQLQQQQQQAVQSPAAAAQVILCSPAAPLPPASPSSLASSPANPSHPYSVPSPAPAQSPGPAVQFYRAAPSPQQRSNSLSSTPVASPINYPPGPGPGGNGNGQTQQSVQLPAGTITIPTLTTAAGQVQQLMSTGGQVLQILNAPSPQMVAAANSPGGPVRHAQPAVRAKQPQLRPKPAGGNSNASSPGPSTSVGSPRPAPAPQQQAVQQQQTIQQQVVQQQTVIQQQQPQQQHATGQVVQLGTGGPTGTLVFGAQNPGMFPALAPTGGQFFLQQQGSGGFQLIVRPPAANKPVAQQQQQQTIVMQPQLGPVLNHRPSAGNATAAAPPPQPTLAQPMVRLVTLPGLGTVQLQQIQTPNGPAYLAVQQPQQTQPQPTFLRVAQQPQTFIQQQPAQDTVRLVTSPATIVGEVTSDSSNCSTTFATPPVKKAPAKKKPKKKAAVKVEVQQQPPVEEKRPVQVNLAELMKETGIDDEFFMDDEPAPPPPPPPIVQPAETKENNLTAGQVVQSDGPTLSETNLIQTLQQHGLALSADDLHTLRNFIKPVEQSASALPGDGINGLTKEEVKPTVSLTLGNGQVIQLTDQPLEAAQPPKVQFVTFQQPSIVTTTTEVHHQVQHHGFQNEFLEDLARSQILSDPKKAKNKTAPARTPTNTAATNNNKKKPEPKKKKPTAAVVSVAPPTTPTNSGPVPRVQTIKLSPENQQVRISCPSQVI